MTLKTCLEREKVFREQGRAKEADFWLARAKLRGYKPEEQKPEEPSKKPKK